MIGLVLAITFGLIVIGLCVYAGRHFLRTYDEAQTLADTQADAYYEYWSYQLEALPGPKPSTQSDPPRRDLVEGWLVNPESEWELVGEALPREELE